MKIEIDLMNSLPLKGQIRAVEKYMFNNIISETKGFDEQLNFSQTKKNEGAKVETDFGNFHVSCHKTKGGIYKFKTWLAI